MPTTDDIAASLAHVAKLLIPAKYVDRVTLDVVSRVGCTDIATEGGHGKFALSGISDVHDMVTRLFHVYAHVLAYQDTHDTLVNAGGRHRVEFKEYVDRLRGELLYTGVPGYAFHIIPYIGDQLPAEVGRASDMIQRYLDARRTSNRYSSGYDRTTLACPVCEYTLTLRSAAAKRLSVTCIDHERVMTP